MYTKYKYMYMSTILIKYSNTSMYTNYNHTYMSTIFVICFQSF